MKLSQTAKMGGELIAPHYQFLYEHLLTTVSTNIRIIPDISKCYLLYSNLYFLLLFCLPKSIYDINVWLILRAFAACV